MAASSPVTISSDESDNDVDTSRFAVLKKSKLIYDNKPLEQHSGNWKRLPKSGLNDSSFGQSTEKAKATSISPIKRNSKDNTTINIGHKEMAHASSAAQGYTDLKYFLDEVVEVSSSVGSDVGGTKSVVPESKNKRVKRKSIDGLEDKGKKKANVALEKKANVALEKKANVVLEKKANVALEKNAKKQKLAEEKAARKAASEMNKIYKSGECMKYMNIEGHPTLWSRWYMSDVGREAAAAGARVLQVASLCDPALVVWTRTLPRSLGNHTGQVKLTPSEERCDRALYIASADELCELVSTHALATQLSQVRQLCGCELTLVVFRVDEYFKSPTRRKTSNSNRTPMSEIDLELAITDLLVSADCDTVIVNTPNELALLIVQFTKAIAKAPLKKAQRECDEMATFFMRGDNKNCISVDKDGTGISRLWQQMVAILPQSSLETSRAICSRYKTPLALYQALQFSNSIAEVANIGVSRAGAPGSKARRVGPEFARKLHTLFTAQQGDTLVE